MIQRCLLIADDLTGGSDAGAQFAKWGLKTLLICWKDDAGIDLSKYDHRDVLVINTDSRGLSPEKASSLISNLFKNYDKQFFPIIYKKIDSTLRGNIGCEIDSILNKMDGAPCFMAPSYPEQNRTLVGSILIVGEKPLAFSEVARNTPSPVEESHVYQILQNQSRNHVGWIDLTHVASTIERLLKAVEEVERKENRIIIFDAVSRQDLTNVAEVGFSLKTKPLFVGSAGLAEEVAKKIIPSNIRSLNPFRPTVKVFKNIFIVGGTTSSVTRQQLKRIEQRGVPSYHLNKNLLMCDETGGQVERREVSEKVSNSLSRGIVILKTTPEMLLPDDSEHLPIHLKIVKTLADVTLQSLELSNVDIRDLMLILTGGDTAQSIINVLGNEGIEIEGEILEGIVKGHLIGGKWDGLNIITKAGAFGKENALEIIIKMLQDGEGQEINSLNKGKNDGKDPMGN
jgi:uncharacterized protein YgbK (DUF1537 family)